jgi:hypothetical protein
MSVSKTKERIIFDSEFLFVFPNLVPVWSEILQLQHQKKTIQISDCHIITKIQIFDTPIQKRFKIHQNNEIQKHLLVKQCDKTTTTPTNMKMKYNVRRKSKYAGNKIKL